MPICTLKGIVVTVTILPVHTGLKEIASYSNVIVEQLKLQSTVRPQQSELDR